MASTLLSSVSGSGGLPKLAPDLTYPSDKSVAANYIRITGIDATGSLTTALSLTGKFLITDIELSFLAAETSTVKLTVDGVVIWNDTYTTSTSTTVLLGGAVNIGSNHADAVIQCETSLLLELQTITANSVILDYLARPIL